jgi:hypothetical protein
MSVVHFILCPLLLFVSFYIIGRTIDLASDFPSILLCLFVGSLAGHLIGYFSLNVGSYTPPSSHLELLWFALDLLYMAFSLEFFAGFTALTISYITKKRLTVQLSLEKE